MKKWGWLFLVLLARPVLADSASFPAMSDDVTLYGSSTVYATAGSTYTGNLAGSNFVVIGQDLSTPGSVYDIYRGFIQFDISSIPVGSTITGVTLTGTVGLTAFDGGGTSVWTVQVRDGWNNSTAISSANYTACIGQTLDVVWCDAATTCHTAGQTPTSPAMNTSSVVPTGAGARARYCFTSSRDGVTAPAPAGARELVDFYSSEFGTPVLLNVTWFPPGPTPTQTPTTTPTPTQTPTANPVTPTKLPTNPGGTPPRCGERTIP